MNPPNRYMLVDDASGVAELEKHNTPKVRIMEGVIIGAAVGFTFILVLVAVHIFFHH